MATGTKLGKASAAGGDLSEINISPMIDMVFILLIFFIVTTVFVEEPGVEIEREYATQAKRLERNSLIFAITSNDSVAFGGRQVGVNGVRPIVSRNMAQQEMPVIIQADRASSAGTLTRVISEIKLAYPEATVTIATRQNR